MFISEEEQFEELEEICSLNKSSKKGIVWNEGNQFIYLLGL